MPSNVLVSPLPSREKSSLFIAANLYNNENILEHWMSQVDRLVEWAGPTRTYISIYENGNISNLLDPKTQVKLISATLHQVAKTEPRSC